VETRAALRALAAAKGDAAALDLRRLMEPSPLVPETRPLLDQLQAFRRSRRHLAVVVDEYGQIEGLVTLHDLIEVVVGEITEAGEQILADAVRGSGEVEVPGETRVRDLNRELDWALPENEAMTVAGLLMAAAQGMPKRGEAATGWRPRICAGGGSRGCGSSRRGRRQGRGSVRRRTAVRPADDPSGLVPAEGFEPPTP
jgi:Mg2+/Co2+ transporter CorB